MSVVYFYTVAGSRNGPVLPADVRSLAERGVIQRDTLVWSKGMSEWTAAAHVFPFFEDLPPPLPRNAEEPPALPLETNPPNDGAAEGVKMKTIGTGIGYMPSAGTDFTGWVFIGIGFFAAAFLAIKILGMSGPLAAGIALGGAWMGNAIFYASPGSRH